MPTPAQLSAWQAHATPGDRVVAATYTALAWLATTGSVIILLVAIDTVRYAIGLRYERVPLWAYWMGGIGAICRFVLVLPNRRLRRELPPVDSVNPRGSPRHRRNTAVKAGFLAAYAIVGRSWLVFTVLAALTASLGVPAVYQVTIGLMGRRRMAAR